MTKRVEQFESTLQRAIAERLRRGLQDPRIKGLISVTRVEVTPDLRTAFVYVSVLPDKYQKRVLAGLNHAARHLGAEVRAQMASRVMPHLAFRYDEQLAKQNAVLGAISEAVRRSGEAGKASEAEVAAAEAAAEAADAGDDASAGGARSRQRQAGDDEDNDDDPRDEEE